MFGKLSTRCFQRRPVWRRHYSNCGDIRHGRSTQGDVIYTVVYGTRYSSDGKIRLNARDGACCDSLTVHLAFSEGVFSRWLRGSIPQPKLGPSSKRKCNPTTNAYQGIYYPYSTTVVARLHGTRLGSARVCIYSTAVNTPFCVGSFARRISSPREQRALLLR